MKLYATITSERGKPTTKAGNEHIRVEILNEDRENILELEVDSKGFYTFHTHGLMDKDDIPM